MQGVALLSNLRVWERLTAARVNALKAGDVLSHALSTNLGGKLAKVPTQTRYTATGTHGVAKGTFEACFFPHNDGTCSTKGIIPRSST